jgi:DNA-binding beta-propeller fold protein YncE
MGAVFGLALVCCVALSASAQNSPTARPALLAATMPAQDAVSLYDVVEGSRLTLKKTVPVGKNPGRMCSASGTLYITTAAGAAAIDLNTLAVTGNFSDPAIKSIFSCLVSRDGAKLYLMDRDASLVFIFASSSRQLLKKLTVPEDPRIAIFTPDGKSLIVSCGDANELAVVDPATDTVRRTVKAIGLDPRAMVFTPDGKNLVVGLVSSDILSWYKADTLEYINSFGVARSPQGLAVAPDGDRVYASGAGEVISIIDARQHKADGTPEPRQANTIPVGPSYSLAISTDGNYLYSAPGDGNGVIVDLRFWRVVKAPALKGAGTVFYVQ